MKTPNMIKLALAAVAVTAMAAPAAASADLAKKSNCTSCHSVDKKMLGPTYKAVAAKYAGQKDAQALLVDKVKNGGSGVWGKIPMPPNKRLSDENANTLVTWILSLK